MITICDYHLGPYQFDPEEVKLLLCDIDGTVADLSHRRHFVANQPKNWKAFNATLHLDKPINDIIDIVNKVFWAGGKVVMCSGREEVYKAITKDWLWHNGVLFHDIYMRAEKDFRDDGQVKRELLYQIRKDYGEPDLVLDDRDRVVKMWREEGVRCVQVAEGDF